MTRYTLSILEELREATRASVLRDASEYAALLVCGRSRHIDPWTGEAEERFLARQLIDVDPSAFSRRSPTAMEWSTTPFYKSLKLVEPKDFGLAVVHSHPIGPLEFSDADDVADRELFEIAFNRLDSDRPHLSVVMDGSGNMIARAYSGDLVPHAVTTWRTIGKAWQFDIDGVAKTAVGAELDRQVRTFGSKSTEILGRLRVGIVGCGGTGSAVAALLGRVGLRYIALFDPDCVDDSNLNRLHFSTRFDANLGRSKVDVVGEGMSAIGLPMSVKRYRLAVDDEEARDPICTCDIVFGCTDDHLGRNFLNRLAHFYLIPVIDLGLLIEPRESGGYDTFDGRVTVVQPGYPCQLCRGLINTRTMQQEDLRRHDPLVFQQHRRAGYIPDGEPNPAVVTFTTEVATMAINEVFQRLNGFRGEDGYCGERVRRFDEVKDADRVPGGMRRPGCKLCQVRKYDGRGDMQPFLDQA